MRMSIDVLQKYINALRKCAKEHDNDTTYTGHINVSGLCRVTANLLEALEQEPKTGHWVEEKINGGGRKVFCSECGCAPPFEYVSTGSASGYGVINKTKYCPNCGARMVEPQESEG